MAGIEGALARKLDFGELPATVTGTGRGRAGLWLAAAGRVAGPGKYRVLELRRRQAQIRARHLLDLLDDGWRQAGARAGAGDRVGEGERAGRPSAPVAAGRGR